MALLNPNDTKTELNKIIGVGYTCAYYLYSLNLYDR